MYADRRQTPIDGNSSHDPKGQIFIWEHTEEMLYMLHIINNEAIPLLETIFMLQCDDKY
jgi:hypothetical protein